MLKAYDVMIATYLLYSILSLLLLLLSLLLLPILYSDFGMSRFTENEDGAQTKNAFGPLKVTSEADTFIIIKISSPHGIVHFCLLIIEN